MVSISSKLVWNFLKSEMKTVKVNGVVYEMARMLMKKTSSRSPDEVFTKLVEERYKKEIRKRETNKNQERRL